MDGSSARPLPHTPNNLVRAVGDRQILGPREIASHEESAGRLVSHAGVRELVRAAGYSDRATVESHAPDVRTEKAEDLARLLVNERRNLGVRPRVVEQCPLEEPGQ